MRRVDFIRNEMELLEGVHGGAISSVLREVRYCWRRFMVGHLTDWEDISDHSQL